MAKKTVGAKKSGPDISAAAKRRLADKTKADVKPAKKAFGDKKAPPFMAAAAKRAGSKGNPATPETATAGASGAGATATK